jgi:hypothetical protein
MLAWFDFRREVWIINRGKNHTIIRVTNMRTSSKTNTR